MLSLSLRKPLLADAGSTDHRRGAYSLHPGLATGQGRRAGVWTSARVRKVVRKGLRREIVENRAGQGAGPHQAAIGAAITLPPTHRLAGGPESSMLLQRNLEFERWGREAVQDEARSGRRD